MKRRKMNRRNKLSHRVEKNELTSDMRKKTPI
jgi:hypothetical protein